MGVWVSWADQRIYLLETARASKINSYRSAYIYSYKSACIVSLFLNMFIFTKNIFTSGFCSFMVKFEEKYPFLFNFFFFFYKIQYYRVGQISVDSLNKVIKGKKMNLPSK